MKYFAFRLVAWLARCLPRRLTMVGAWCVGQALYWTKRQDRLGIRANLRRITEHSGLKLSLRELARMSREVFPNFCLTVSDFFAMQRLSSSGIREKVRWTGDSAVQKCLDEGRGLILVTGHIGNWEIGACTLAAHGFKVNAVVLNQPTRELNELFQGQRREGGLKIIPMGRAARGSLEALKRGEILAIVADRDFSSAMNLVPFFGKPARFPRGPARLSVATRAPVLPGVCVREPDGQYRLSFGSPLRPDDSPDAEEKMNQAIAKEIEGFVARWPTQWFVFHDFWDIEKNRSISLAALKQAAS